MKNIKIAAIQMSCNKNQDLNLIKAEKMIRQAKDNGANIILLPELFDRQYFCQERRYDYYKFAIDYNNHPSCIMAKRLAKELNVVLPVSFYEKNGNVLYNSVIVYDADGENLGIYRKTHIPDDHFYQEKFYFTPGDTGFKVFETKFAKIGIGICWDQWFPETVRSLTLKGAEVILFPTAIGSEPILDIDSKCHWQRAMCGHAACNIIPVIAANRVGDEIVEANILNNYQNSSLLFYGSSFISDEFGNIVKEASRNKEEIIYHEFDVDLINEKRLAWGLFRDRRKEMYSSLIEE